MKGEDPPSLLDPGEFARFTEEQREDLSVCWTGWYWGKIEDAFACNPRFVTEFGVQALPDPTHLASEASDIGELGRVGFQPDVFLKATGVLPGRLDELSRSSQEYQARSHEYLIEELRLKKYNNCNGLLAFHLVSTYPSADWSVVDHRRKPKTAYWVIREKLQPVLPVANLEPIRENEVVLSAHVINDLRCKLECESLTLSLVDKSGCKLQQGELENFLVGADAVARVGTLTFSLVAASQTARIRLRLRIRARGTFENTQRWRVVEQLQKAPGVTRG